MGFRTKEQQRKYNQTYKEKNRKKISLNKKKYATDNKDKIKIYREKFYLKNKDKLNEQMKTYYKDNRNVYLFLKSKRRAREDGIEFNISIEDIVIPEYCPLLNIKLTNELGYGQLKTNSSIDRIDSTKGYVKGNIQVISRQANTMKSNATREELIIFSKNILKEYVNV